MATNEAQRALVVIGEVRQSALDTMRTAAAGENLRCLHVPDAHDLGAILEGRPLAIVLAVDTGTFPATCGLLRAEASLLPVPILGLSVDRSDLAFGDLYHAGGDDLLDLLDESSSRALLRRLRGLDKHSVVAPEPGTAAATRSLAIDEDLPLHARALANAGVDRLVLRLDDTALDQVREARCVVSSEEHARTALAAARGAGVVTPWVIVASPRSASAVAAWSREFPAVAVVDALAPPENVLFIANELTRAGGSSNARVAVRSLFGTRVGFRRAARDEADEIGFSYNVSDNGIFVRTLAPLEQGDEAWLEMWAPRSSRVVRLTGRAVWRRAFGSDDTAIVPPGFAVRIDGGLPGDLEVWRTGCALLEREGRAPIEPNFVR